MSYSKDIIKQADDLINAMRHANVPNFQSDVFRSLSRKLIQDMVKAAKTLHRIAEHNCNGYEYPGMLKREANLERKISEIASGFGLSVRFFGDPRGYVVKLHAPMENVYNTLGGAESGYGIG